MRYTETGFPPMISSGVTVDSLKLSRAASVFEELNLDGNCT